MSDEKKPRNFVHVPFDRMTCPIAGCTLGVDGAPQEGTVPGIKRHVRSMHSSSYSKVEWPPLRTLDPVST